MGDLQYELQKNFTVETTGKFEAKMTLSVLFFISGRSSADPSKKLSCFLYIPKGVLKYERKKFWIWNFVRVRFAGWELLILSSHQKWGRKPQRNQKGTKQAKWDKSETKMGLELDQSGSKMKWSRTKVGQKWYHIAQSFNKQSRLNENFLAMLNKS